MAEGRGLENLIGEQAEDRDAQTRPVAADAAAIAMAMDQAAGDPEVRANASTFLRAQTRLVDLQVKHFDEERRLAIGAAKRKRFGDRLRNAFQFFLAVMVVGVVVGLAVMIWRAHQAKGNVIESFSVPPAFAGRGVTGEVLAGDLMDRLASLTRTANAISFSSSSEVSAEPTDTVRVEIPQTGVAVGEIWRLARAWLGNERHISGNLRDLGDGRIALTVRVDGEAADTVLGAAGDLAALEQQLAERLFSRSDPGNYIIFLQSRGRTSEARAANMVFLQEARTLIDRADAFALMGSLARDLTRKLAFAKIAMDIDPKLMVAHLIAARAEQGLDHPQEVLAQARAISALKDTDQPDRHRVHGLGRLRAEARAIVESLTGDHAAAFADRLIADRTAYGRLLDQAGDAAALHDLARARGLLVQAQFLNPLPASLLSARYALAAAQGDWPAAANLAAALVADARQRALKAADADEKAGAEREARGLYEPMLIEARTRAGDLAGAMAAIGDLPPDCYHCLLARARLRGAVGDTAGASDLFAQATRQAPSIPEAYWAWGEWLLAKGDPAGAIARFATAHQKGPRLAEPLKGWGDALARQGRWDAAVAKYDEAQNAAPAWTALRQAKDAAVRRPS